MKRVIFALLFCATVFAQDRGNSPEARLAILIKDSVWIPPIRADWRDVLAVPIQDRIPITKIDPATWMWSKDSTLVVMRVTVLSRDTIATYKHYKLVKSVKVNHFNLKRLLDGEK